MSNRQLRKLRQYQELQLRKNAGTDDKLGPVEDEEEDIQLVERTRPKTSLFAALGNQDDDDDDDDDDEEEQQQHQQQQQQQQHKEGVTARDENEDMPQPRPATKGKRKKKKQKKPRKPKKVDAIAEPTTVELPADVEDEIDKALKELNIQTATFTMPTTNMTLHHPLDDLLNINPNYLRPSNEMISMFGRGVVETAQEQEQTERAAALRERMRHGGQREVDIETYLRGDPREKLPEISLKRNVFVLGREHWPRATTGGLAMKLVGPMKDGTGTEYAFAHDITYDGVQGEFFHYVLRGDPSPIIRLVIDHPYHVSSLLQASNFFKHNQDTTLAAELCERALFAFGRVTTAAFRRDLENGTARLDFHRPENRQFWLAGYMWLKSLLQKGTYRTALEWAKLMFSLDRRDPYAMRQFIHVTAIKAEEPGWLLKFVTEDKDAAAAGDPSHVYMAQTKAVAYVQLNSLEDAKQSIHKGIARVPWLYAWLFKVLHLDLPPSIWGAQPPGDHALWAAFYVYLAKDIWNNPACISVLKEAASTAPKPPSAVLDDPTPATVSLHVARVVFLEGSRALLSAVPQHYMTMQPNFDFDPLPPPEATNIFTTEASQLPWRYARANGPTDEPHDAGDNPDHAGVAPLEDDEGHHMLFRQYLAGEGRRLLQERAEAARGNGEEVEEGFIEAFGGAYDEEQHTQHEGDDGEDEEPRYSRLEMIGLQAWILQQLAPLTATREAGEDAQRQQQDQGQEEGAEVESGDVNVELGRGRDVLPGSWPDNEH